MGFRAIEPRDGVHAARLDYEWYIADYGYQNVKQVQDIIGNFHAYHWTDGKPGILNITYSFVHHYSDFDPNEYEHRSEFRGSVVSNWEAYNAIKAFEAWDAIHPNVSFSEVDDSQSSRSGSAMEAGDIRVGISDFSDHNIDDIAYSYGLGDKELEGRAAKAGDIWFQTSKAEGKAFEEGSKEFEVLLQEIGHAAYGFEGSPSGAWNSTLWSVMSDKHFVGKDHGKSVTLYAATPMYLDVLAAQAAYGQAQVRLGYAEVDGHSLRTIFSEFGGTTLLWKDTADAYINLTPGRLTKDAYGGLSIAESDMDIGWSGVRDADGFDKADWRFFIAPGTYIEFVTGGSGNDYIIGSDRSNTIKGAGGNDTIKGGGGIDTVEYNGHLAEYKVVLLDDGGLKIIDQFKIHVDTFGNVLESDGVDRVWDVDYFQFADQKVSAETLRGLAQNGMALANATATIAEHTAMATRVKVADILVTDDENNELWLSGADASLFELKGQALFLKAGVSLDHAQQASFKVTVHAGQAGEPGSVSTGYTLAVKEVTIEGTAKADTLVGTAYNDKMNGGAGNDRIEGGAGNDTLHGNDGNDVVYGEDGNDTIYGDDGDDVLRGQGGDDTMYGGAGKDDIAGSGGADKLYGNGGDDLLNGGSGNDLIDGGSGNDTIEGQDGDDTISGDTGDDDIDGGTGNDTVNGGDGDDRIEAGDGNDLVHGDAGDDLVYGGEGADTIYGDDGDDVLRGQNGDDKMYGGSGNDDIGGNSGNDKLYGNGGHDVLNGGAGNDLLDGASGNDTLDGGTGDDTLTGAAGNDTFVFNKGYGHDTITDFEWKGGVDVIKLDLDNTKLDSFAEIMKVAHDEGGSVVFEFSATDQLVIEGVKKASLLADDFLFV